MKQLRDIISGTLLIAGTAIGAGMLGIPLMTAKAGFFPAVIITVLVWLFMVCTGFLFLEATLWMHHFWLCKETNVISMTKRYLGEKFKILAAFTFIFLYYCLMVAYFSAGAPLFFAFIKSVFGFEIIGWSSFFLFGLLCGIIVSFGIKFIDRLNYILMMGLFLSYAFLMGAGVESIQTARFTTTNWSYMLFVAPILFSAFGYHNVIPSLATHFGSSGKVMRHSIFWGTFIPLIVYLLWQWLIIGAVPSDLILNALSSGQPITGALEKLEGKKWITLAGNYFGFFAIITSLLGVAFSVVDFLGDGLKMKRKGKDRVLLCLLTFAPPFILTSLNPNLFVLAISIAGGFGEAFLNGILPILLVWVGRYHKKMHSEYALPGGKITLALLLLAGLLVMVTEVLFLLF